MLMQGEYVVLAARGAGPVGVDVMDIRTPTRQSVPQYFALMQRQFTQSEWAAITKPQLEIDRLVSAYTIVLLHL